MHSNNCCYCTSQMTSIMFMLQFLCCSDIWLGQEPQHSTLWMHWKCPLGSFYLSTYSLLEIGFLIKWTASRPHPSNSSWSTAPPPYIIKIGPRPPPVMFNGGAHQNLTNFFRLWAKLRHKPIYDIICCDEKPYKHAESEWGLKRSFGLKRVATLFADKLTRLWFQGILD